VYIPDVGLRTRKWYRSSLFVVESEIYRSTIAGLPQA
jgi:hypothetical protein